MPLTRRSRTLPLIYVLKQEQDLKTGTFEEQEAYSPWRREQGLIQLNSQESSQVKYGTIQEPRLLKKIYIQS